MHNKLRVFVLLLTLTLPIPLLMAQALETDSPEQAVAAPDQAEPQTSEAVAESALGTVPPPKAPQEHVAPPKNVVAKDTPADDGTSITISWEASDTPGITGYEVFMEDVSAGAQPQSVMVTQADTLGFKDSDPDKQRIIAGHEYRYHVRALKNEATSELVASAQTAIPESEWFSTDPTVISVAFGVVLICTGFTVFLIKGKKGKQFYIRPIAGIQNIDDAMGRATEMGRPILYILGIGLIDSIATIASLTILSRVAKKAAEYDTPIIVPCIDYIVFPVAQEIVRTAYSDAGRPDAFKPESVYYVTSSQFPYVSNVCGTIQREKPATNFFLGYFQAESLILAETGAATGAIQIAGTDSDSQLPFFITACDYTLIGEELYAASAYLSRDPLLLGTLKAQDFGKAIILFALIIGAVLVIFDVTFFLDWFPTE